MGVPVRSCHVPRPGHRAHYFCPRSPGQNSSHTITPHSGGAGKWHLAVCFMEEEMDLVLTVPFQSHLLYERKWNNSWNDLSMIG